MSDFLFEKLAEVAHLIWARWAMYAEEHNDAEHRQRWRIQARTLYADLSESEKEFDREIADQWIAAMDIGQCAEMRFLRDNLTERELQVRHLVRTHEQTVDNLVAQMDSLQARVAELEKEHPVFVAAVAWATGREPFASATLEEAVDDYREETKL